jgi:hypothetical protein
MPQAMAEAEVLINLVDYLDMTMALPKGVPTLKHMVMKNLSQPDNIFCSTAMKDILTICDIDALLQPPKMDHFPIITSINITQECTVPKPFRNFQDVDWSEFHMTLETKLSLLPPPSVISLLQALTARVEDLTKAIQETITTEVPVNNPVLRSKRWWTKELSKMKKMVNRLNSMAFKYHTLPDHPMHKDL